MVVSNTEAKKRATREAAQEVFNVAQAKLVEKLGTRNVFMAVVVVAEDGEEVTMAKHSNGALPEEAETAIFKHLGGC